MIRPLTALSLILPLSACIPPPVPPGAISGTPVLAPEGCDDPAIRDCRLRTEIRYRPAATPGVVWASKVYDGAPPDGTTDGASIPEPFWGLIGHPFTPAFLRPAILHDHYTYPENRVRPWRDTHRMFHDALRDEGVEPVKALWMYYAVYTFGAHWAELVPGEGCGDGCVQLQDARRYVLSEPARIETEAAIADLWQVWRILNDPRRTTSLDGPEALAGIEALALARHPDNLLLREGAVIEQTPEIFDWIAARGYDLIQVEAP